MTPEKMRLCHPQLPNHIRYIFKHEPHVLLGMSHRWLVAQLNKMCNCASFLTRLACKINLQEIENHETKQSEEVFPD